MRVTLHPLHMLHHYVYKVTFGCQYYIGVRSSKVSPEDDWRYLGSGNFILYKIKYFPPVKEILSVHETREEAEKEESRLIRIHIKDYRCKNRRVTSPRKNKRVQQAVH